MRTVIGILAATCITASAALVQGQELDVSVDGGTFPEGSDVAISVSLKQVGSKPGRLPSQASDPTTFYHVCTTDNAKDKWTKGQSVFCSVDGKTKIDTSANEAAPELLGLSSSRHTMADKLTLPKAPSGRYLWVVAHLAYKVPNLPPGNSRSGMGAMYLIRKCEGQGDITSKINCRYLTPGQLAKEAALGGKPSPPNP
jgi:hypothetical protein